MVGAAMPAAIKAAARASMVRRVVIRSLPPTRPPKRLQLRRWRPQTLLYFAPFPIIANGISPTSPIRPAVLRFSPGKSLSGKERGRLKRGKSAVAPIKSILTATNVAIIGGIMFFRCKVRAGSTSAASTHRGDAARLLLRQRPNAIPINAGRGDVKLFDALQEQFAWRIAGRNGKAVLEPGARSLPILMPIGIERLDIGLAQR